MPPGRQRAETRAAVTRSFYEQQLAKLGTRSDLFKLPARICPVSLSDVGAVLHHTNKDASVAAARSQALAALGSERIGRRARSQRDGLVMSLLGDEPSGTDETTGDGCDCCAARGVGHITLHKTSVEFSESLVTTVTTIVEVPRDKIDWNVLVSTCNPLNWKKNQEYFANSDWMGDGPAPGDTDSWEGPLHERFDWHWNVDAEAMFDNDLWVEFHNDPLGHKLHCEYSLVCSNECKVWSARESGGLDVDSGNVKVGLKGASVRIEATKNLRHTDPELGPPNLGAMLNYLAPATTGLWMHQAIQTGIEHALRESARLPKRQPAKTLWGRIGDVILHPFHGHETRDKHAE